MALPRHMTTRPAILPSTLRMVMVGCDGQLPQLVIARTAAEVLDDRALPCQSCRHVSALSLSEAAQKRRDKHCISRYKLPKPRIESTSLTTFLSCSDLML
jgi:hypothetical protein